MHRPLHGRVVVSYTGSGDEINAFQHDERSVDICGYVDSIDGLKPVRTVQGHVFKFTLNNNEHVRMKILIWGTAMAKLWESQIQMWSVVELRGGTVKTGNPRYREADAHELEYHVQPSSDIQILGTFRPDIQPRKIQYRAVDMADIMSEQGPVELDCYIRTQPRTVQLNRASCGQLQVTDGYYRLAVNIASYTPNENLVVGAPVTIFSEVPRDSSLFAVADMNGIVIRQRDAMMSLEAVRAGFHPVIAVRRRRIDENPAELAQPIVPAVQAPVLAPVVQAPVVPVIIQQGARPVLANNEPVVPVMVQAVNEPVVPVNEANVLANNEPVVPVNEANVLANDEPVVPVMLQAVNEPVMPAIVQQAA
ncbi:uncharacterized protein LOC122855111 isoform X2 [Aphidius gifuensis]|uniref:uncharacterized protein LOC122855111 isoform X2 n=1 Tax=Aphidius gifuensis TaxID=684658 RepID=UPI001CDD46E0|nr:uncharacterized protein LOC122855111 isoform X2 [Aphidius gifuensis]